MTKADKILLAIAVIALRSTRDLFKAAAQAAVDDAIATLEARLGEPVAQPQFGGGGGPG